MSTGMPARPAFVASLSSIAPIPSLAALASLPLVLSLTLLAATARAAPPVDCAADQRGPFADLCVHEARVGRMVTIDLKIRDSMAEREFTVVDVPYANIRSTGVVVQLFYNSAFGKAQWVPFPGMAGVYVHPDGLMLPVRKWMTQGLTPGRIVRIVLLFGQ